VTAEGRNILCSSQGNGYSMPTIILK